MIVFLYVVFAIIAGLIISLILPEGLKDINIGFYLIITGLLAVGALAVMLRKKLIFFKTISDYFLIILLLVFVAEGVMIYFSPDDVPTGNEQAIIVTGSGLFIESRLTTELSERIDRALEIHQSNPHLPIILSGGTDENLALPQCVAMEAYIEKQAIAMGISVPQIITDDTSSGIFDNITFSLEKSGAESAYIIVSRHNVPRTKIIKSRISPGSTVIGADYPVSKYLIYYIRELGYALKTLICDGII